jgi:hypothetical protein
MSPPRDVPQPDQSDLFGKTPRVKPVPSDSLSRGTADRGVGAPDPRTARDAVSQEANRMGSDDPDSEFVRRRRSLSRRAREEHAAEGSGHSSMFEFTPGSQTVAPKPLDPFKAFDAAWFRARSRAEETFEGVTKRTIQLFAQARSVTITWPSEPGRPVPAVSTVPSATPAAIADPVQPLLEQLEEAWNAQRDPGLVDRLAAIYPAHALELHEFFSELVEAELDRDRTRPEFTGQDARTRQWLERKGFALAAAAKEAAAKETSALTPTDPSRARVTVTIAGYRFEAERPTTVDAMNALAATARRGHEAAVSQDLASTKRAPSALETVWAKLSPEELNEKEVWAHMTQRKMLFTHMRDRGQSFTVSPLDFEFAARVGVMITAAVTEPEVVAFFQAVDRATRRAELDASEALSRHVQLPGEAIDTFNARVGSLEQFRVDRYIDDAANRATAGHREAMKDEKGASDVAPLNAPMRMD